MKEHIHSRIAKILVVLALAVVASVMFVFVGCNNECAHENTHNEVVAAATCTTEGITRTVCDDCGHVTESKTAALGHDWDEGTVVAATCTAGGYTLQTCSRCTAQRQVESTEPTGHTWDAGKVVAATCTTGGYTLQTCEACGAQQQVNPTEPTGHNYAIDESKTVAGTCLTNGSVTYVCADCGDTYTEQTALGQHNYEKVTVASTCTTAGYTAERCTVCGNERNRENLPLAKHNFERDDEHSYAATCTVDGVEIEVCANCGITNTYTLKATGHKWGEAETVAPTCTKDGYSIHTCTVCNTEQRYDTVEAAGHKWDNEKVLTQEPTCTERGYTYVPCLNCTERQTIDILDALGHSFVYSAKTVITPATCTTNGSMTAPCTRCGTMHTYTGNQLAAMDADDLNALNIPNDVFTKAEYNLVNKGAYPTEDGAFTFLVSPGHDYAYDNKYPCVVVDTLEDGTKLWNVCDRCEENFVAVDHTMPEGALPCVSIADNENYKGDVTGLTDEQKEANAYKCTVCGNLQPVLDHDFERCYLESGNPMMGDIDDCVFKPYEDQDIRLDCTVYLRCKDCEHIEIAAPHSWPEDGDEGYLANCGHGDKCLVCGLELTMALDHDRNGVSDSSNPVEFAAGIKYQAPTCTEVGYEYEYCTGCVTRAHYKDNPEVVEWVEGVNYWTIEIPATEHNDWAATNVNTITISRLGDDKVLNCLDGTWNRDICTVEGCNAVRISVKPDFYFYAPDQEKYIAISDEATFNRAAETDNLFTANDDGTYTEIVVTMFDKLSWTTDKYGRPWTDENGNYGGAEPGEHTWHLLPLEEYTKEQEREYQDVTCVDNARVLVYCDVCGMGKQDYTAGNVQVWRTFKHNPKGTELGLDDYYDYLVDAGIFLDNKAILDEEQKIDALIANYKELGIWHKDAMLPCGHDYCYACVKGNHNDQYSIDIRFASKDEDLKLPANLEDIPYYSCRTDAENQTRLNEILYEIRVSAAAEGVIYNFTYFNDRATTDSTSIEEFFVGRVNGEQVYLDKTLYVAVEGVPLTTYLAIDGYVASWGTDDDLEIGWAMVQDLIPYTSITSITVDLQDAEGNSCVKAVSEGAQLEAYIDACEPYWESDTDGTLAFSIDGFTTATGEQACWTYTNTTNIDKPADLTGYKVVVTVVANGATFVVEATVA